MKIILFCINYYFARTVYYSVHYCILVTANYYSLRFSQFSYFQQTCTHYYILYNLKASFKTSYNSIYSFIFNDSCISMISTSLTIFIYACVSNKTATHSRGAIKKSKPEKQSSILYRTVRQKVSGKWGVVVHTLLVHTIVLLSK